MAGYVYRGAEPWVPPTPEPDAAGLKPCGTYAAYRRHKRRGEDPCPPCLDARNADNRERKARERAVGV